MRPSILGICFLVALGCSDSTGPAPLDLSGVWQYSENISAPSVGVSCTSSGTVTVNQSGANFTGIAVAEEGICSDSQGTVIDNTGTQSISGGQVRGNTVSFQVPNCQLTGTVSGNPPNQMSGTETCTIALAGSNITFTGTWQASR